MKLSFILAISSVLTLISDKEVFSSPVEYIYHHNNNHDVFNTPHHVFHHEYDGYDGHHDNDHHQHPPPTAECNLHVNTYPTPNNADVYPGSNKQAYYYNNQQPVYTPPSYSPTRNYNYNPRNPPYSPPARRYPYQGVGSRTSNYYVSPRNHQSQSTLKTGTSLVSGGRYYGNNGNPNYYGSNYGYGNYGYKKK